MLPLTPKQLEILVFIQNFLDKRALPPTRGEIADGLGLRNRQGIDQHLRALEIKGVIELVPGISRGIRLIGRVPDSETKLEEAHRIGLPLLGRIAAGTPILATENIEDLVQVDAALFKPQATFLLRVSGDSMKDANIFDRDLLAVHQTAEARNGQIVVARIGDEATVKYYRRAGHLVSLEPANAEYKPIEIDLHSHEMSIEGLAVGVIRTGIGKR